MGSFVHSFMTPRYSIFILNNVSANYWSSRGFISLPQITNNKFSRQVVAKNFPSIPGKQGIFCGWKTPTCKGKDKPRLVPILQLINWQCVTHWRVKHFFFTVQNNQMYNIASHLYSIRAFFALYFMQLDNKTEYCLPFENEWNINKSTLHYLCCPLGQISYVFASSLSLLSFSGYSCLLGRHQNV